MSLLRRKVITEQPAERRLARTLSWPHLVALGVGAIVGTGILTLIGVAADRAGPAVLLSFAVAGAICACAALCYAEMATTIPASGSAYTYSYAVLGEIIAWVVGWSLILEYSLVVATVAVGWSGYAVGFLHGVGVDLPIWLTAGPVLGGVGCDGVSHAGSFGINVPAVAIIALVAALLSAGTQESARINTALVVLKIATLALFVAVALPRFDAANLHPFAPMGLGSTVGACGVKHGMMGAAAIIFFAFYGFDAISTAAEEAKRPERDLAIGIVGAMAACTVIYLVVAAAAVGALPYTRFANSPEPLALILRGAGAGSDRDDRRRGGGDRVAHGDPRLPVRAKPHLPRHGARRLPATCPRARVGARHTGADHRADRGVRQRHRRPGSARPDREPRQCRHAVRVHRSRVVRAGAAAARAWRQAAVPDAGGLAGRTAGDRWLPVPIHQSVGTDAALLPGVEWGRIADLFRLRAAPGDGLTRSDTFLRQSAPRPFPVAASSPPERRLPNCGAVL